jgi:hypothetical protein
MNCVRTVPWVRGVHEKYGPRGVQVIGIHTPEFAFERKRDLLLAEMKRLGVTWPQLVDDDERYWKALQNLYWPTTYLVDKCGRIRARHIGEVHADQDSGRQLEARIEALLAESTSCG